MARLKQQAKKQIFTTARANSGKNAFIKTGKGIWTRYDDSPDNNFKYVGR